MSLKHGSLAGSALDSLRKQGLFVPEKPEYDIPSLPVELTDLGDEALMELYSQLTAYADFISVQVSCAIIDERQVEKALSSKTDRMMLSASGSGEKRVTFARAEIAADEAVQALKQEVDVIYAYRKLIESLAGNIERDTFLVSRELTRRTSTAAGRRGYTT